MINENAKEGETAKHLDIILSESILQLATPSFWTHRCEGVGDCGMKLLKKNIPWQLVKKARMDPERDSIELIYWKLLSTRGLPT